MSDLTNGISRNDVIFYSTFHIIHGKALHSYLFVSEIVSLHLGDLLCQTGWIILLGVALHFVCLHVSIDCFCHYINLKIVLMTFCILTTRFPPTTYALIAT